MSDEDWKRYKAPINGKGSTGDGIVDDWERELAAGRVDIHELETRE